MLGRLRRVTTLRPQAIASCRRFFATELPPHEIVPMPALSPTMEFGGIAKWTKTTGQEIGAGDILVEIETDKATVDFEAQDDAFLAKILVEAGTSDVPCGTPIAVLVEEESDIPAFADFVATMDDPAPTPPTPSPPTTDASPALSSLSSPSSPSSSPSSPAVHTGRIPSISFRHGNRAAINTSLGLASSTSAAASSSPSIEAVLVPDDPRGHTDIPLTAMRKIIAGRLTESKATIPHYYTRMECNIDNMLSFRKVLKTSGVQVSVNDLVIVAAALALRDVPEANSFWTGTHIEQNDTVDISVAVATEGGLITPIVKQADCIGLSVSGGTRGLGVAVWWLWWCSKHVGQC